MSQIRLVLDTQITQEDHEETIVVHMALHFLTMPETKRARVLQLLKETGVLRPRDLEEIGISGVYLNKLYAEGLLERPSRGLYTLADSEPSEHRTIAEAGKRIPQGVICLLSALRFHDLTQKEDFGVVLIRYGLERLLYRLSQSRYRDQFVLKGAMLLQFVDS